jgi:energy-coupling factor transport system ATP-binding protein
LNISIRNLCYTYESGESETLHDISLDIPQGEFVILTGKSGCGKTTLTRCINGLIPHFYEGEMAGDVLIDKAKTADEPMYELARQVGSVFQDPRSQFFTTSTTDEVAFGCENLAMPPRQINQNIDAEFVRLGIEDLRDRSIFELSSGERQKIAIASICAMNPCIFVLDEPSANLDTDATQVLKETLRLLKSAGHTVVVSEHKLYYLSDLADRVVYMRDGTIDDIWSWEQIEAMSRQEREALGLRAFHIDKALQCSQVTERERNPSPLLEASGLRVAGKKHVILDNLDFSAGGSPNEIVGITGSNGVGKTTLARCLCGLHKKYTGEIRIDGVAMKPAQLRKRVYFVMQDADYQLFTESVKTELRFGHKESPELEAAILRAMDALGLHDRADVHPMTLSGGQKQRLTIACAALSDADVLILDEPTSGLDRENMIALSDLLKDLATKGKLIIVISHDQEFLEECCNRCLQISGYQLIAGIYAPPDNLNAVSPQPRTYRSRSYVFNKSGNCTTQAVISDG